ncbi:hypothetical protein BGX34_006670 [Mortierella sp. NVP85]|nr:hypothetical protein BGX34_006670 [Mortierella sp. NVP85]
MPRLNPLDLPHIRETIGRKLNGRHLLNALQVNSEWCQSLLPSVWSSINVHPPQDGDAYDQQPPPYNDIETLIRHQHLVKSIYQTDGFLMDHQHCLTFPNLERIRVYLDRLESFPTTLLLRHARLTHLDFQGRADRPGSFSWAPLMHLTHLKSMRLVHVVVDISEANHFWTIVSKLDQLELQSNHLFGTDPIIPIMLHHLVFPNMKTIVMLDSDSLPLETRLLWMSHCPNLIAFEWKPYPETRSAKRSVLRQLVRLLETRTWRVLQDLILEGLPATDEQIAAILQNIPRLRKLRLADVVFGAASFQALRSHFHCLEDLSISSDAEHCYEFETGPLLIDILASCPKLNSFMTGSLRGHDILMGPNRWACEQSLEYLGADIDILPGSMVEQQQHDIFERLSHLTRLKFLDISDGYGMNLGTLNLTLDKGLRYLASWTRLESIFFCGTLQSMTEAEIDWILQHWKSLKVFIGEPNRDCEYSRQLEEKLQRHGIIVDSDDIAGACSVL